MEAFAKFIESDAFFPVLILLLVMLLGVFVWVMMSGKNEEKKRRAKQKMAVDESAEIKIVQEDIVNVSVEEMAKAMESVSSPEVIQEIPKTEVKESVEDIKPINTEIVDIPKVDIPINSMDETPVDVPTTTIVQEPIEETVEVEKTIIPVPEEKTADELIEMPVVTSQIQNETGEEIIVGNTQTPVANELTVDNNIAFNSTPTEDNQINENIQIEENKEYTGEKTEIFDFPDFNETIDYNNEQENNNIEKDIIDAANKYIESIMKH